MTTPKVDVAELVATNRKRLGLTIDEVDAKAGLTVGTCLGVERGVRAQPGWPILSALAGIGFELSDLFPIRASLRYPRPVPLPKLLKMERARLNLTQVEVCGRMGREKSMYSRLETGDRPRPDMATLARLWEIGFEVGYALPVPGGSRRKRPSPARRDTRRLVGGPYSPPPYEVGGALRCEFHGRDMVVAYASSAPIPWPCAVSPGAYNSPIVCGDLVRAIRDERVAAVAEWWGVSTSQVNRWRRWIGGYQVLHRLWTASEDALLGTASDVDVAQRIGRTTAAVADRRRSLGISPFA